MVTSENNSEETECSCNHLTHFAVLFEYDGTMENILTCFLFVCLFVAMFSIS